MCNLVANCSIELVPLNFRNVSGHKRRLHSHLQWDDGLLTHSDRFGLPTREPFKHCGNCQFLGVCLYRSETHFTCPQLRVSNLGARWSQSAVWPKECSSYPRKRFSEPLTRTSVEHRAKVIEFQHHHDCCGRRADRTRERNRTRLH